MSNSLVNTYDRPLYAYNKEVNSQSSMDKVYPESTLDQIFDQLSPSNKTLREILADLLVEIQTGAMGNIVFPVTSVNTQTGDVVLNKSHVGLMNADNTADIDKPLSTPQRLAILDMLDSYDFKINLSEFTDHIYDYSNPHKVTLEQLDTSNELTIMINKLITIHSLSTDDMVHIDIRREIARTWDYTETMVNKVTTDIENSLKILDAHLQDPDPHPDQFMEKEDVSNKSISFDTDDATHTNYPSTRAVSEHVTRRIAEHDATHPAIDDWVRDLIVIEDKSELPVPNEDVWRKGYFIKFGDTSQSEIARCIRNSDMTFAWTRTPFGALSKFDNQWFYETADGMSLKIDSIIDAIIDENGMLDTSLSLILSDYYTSEYIDSTFVSAVKIVPGTMDGHIQYYINNDITTLSDDIKIPGLKNLAYMELITEDNINPLAVQERHIMNRAVVNRTIADKAVTAEKIACSINSLIGNIKYDGFAHEISISELANAVRPYLEDINYDPDATPDDGGTTPEVTPDPEVEEPETPTTPEPEPEPEDDTTDDLIPAPDTDGTIVPDNYEPGVEYYIKGNNYIQRFVGTISCIANMMTKDTISTDIKYGPMELRDSGGCWVYQSDPAAQAILGGSNITGHTFATITMDANGIYFETISIGDRMNAPYDIWLQYAKIE